MENLRNASCLGAELLKQIILSYSRIATLLDKSSNLHILFLHVLRWTPLMVARSWHRDGLEEILSARPERQPRPLPSPFLCLPLMSIVKIAR